MNAPCVEPRVVLSLIGFLAVTSPLPLTQPPTHPPHTVPNSARQQRAPKAPSSFAVESLLFGVGVEHASMAWVDQRSVRVVRSTTSIHAAGVWC